MAKKFVFLTNIGSSDIEELKIFGDSKEKFLKKTKKILKNNQWENLTLGILEPIIKLLEKNYDLLSSKIILFGTLQYPPHSQDTLYSAEIIKNILLSRFPIEEDQVEVIKINKNPADYEKMHKFYQNVLGGLEEIVESQEFDFIVSITGGTPAQNFALFLNGLFLFPRKIKAVYLFRGQTKPKFIEINKEIYSHIVKKQFEILRKNELYYPILKLSEQWPEFFTIEERNKIELLHNFSLFNFEKVREIIEKSPSFSEEKEKIKEYYEFQKLLKKRKITKRYLQIYKSLLLEVWRDAKRKWYQGEYIDFLGRMFRIQEGMIRFLFEYREKVITEPIEKDKYPEYIEWLKKETLPPLNEIKEKIKKRGKKKFAIEPIKEKYIKKFFPDFYNFFKKIDSLRELRNKSILAHGFRGISQEEIYKNAEFSSAEEFIDYLEKNISHFDRFFERELFFEDLDLKFSGTQISAYFVCPRQLWFLSHHLSMEHCSDLVKIGKSIDKETYQRTKKKIFIEPVQIDFLQEKQKIIGEIKKSRKIEKAHKFQLLYYLLVLKSKGLNFIGELRYPLLRKTQKIVLGRKEQKELKKILEKIEKIISSPSPPKKKGKPYCKKCSYYHLCFA